MSQQSQYEHLYKKYKKKYLLLKQQGGWSIIYVGRWGGQVHQFSTFISYFFSWCVKPNEKSEEPLQFYTYNHTALVTYIKNNNFVVECCTKLNKMEKFISVLEKHNDYKTLPGVLRTEFYGNNPDKLDIPIESIMLINIIIGSITPDATNEQLHSPCAQGDMTMKNYGTCEPNFKQLDMSLKLSAIREKLKPTAMNHSNHYGDLSVQHFMVPRNLQNQTTAVVFSQIIGCIITRFHVALNFLTQNNKVMSARWFGHCLHTIQDSFSHSHVRRDGKRILEIFSFCKQNPLKHIAMDSPSVAIPRLFYNSYKTFTGKSIKEPNHITNDSIIETYLLYLEFSKKVFNIYLYCWEKIIPSQPQPKENIVKEQENIVAVQVEKFRQITEDYCQYIPPPAS